jgi:signal transduction histidine kinase
LTCDVDPQWFQEIMANLLSNASKFSLEGPPITIRADGLAGHVRISVTNKGPDIAEGFRPEIFKPFSQAEPSSTRRHGGTGLGLSICKQLVEQM